MHQADLDEYGYLMQSMRLGPEDVHLCEGDPHSLKDAVEVALKHNISVATLSGSQYHIMRQDAVVQQQPKQVWTCHGGGVQDDCC